MKTFYVTLLFFMSIQIPRYASSIGPLFRVFSKIWHSTSSFQLSFRKDHFPTRGRRRTKNILSRNILGKKDTTVILCLSIQGGSLPPSPSARPTSENNPSSRIQVIEEDTTVPQDVSAKKTDSSYMQELNVQENPFRPTGWSYETEEMEETTSFIDRKNNTKEVHEQEVQKVEGSIFMKTQQILKEKWANALMSRQSNGNVTSQNLNSLKEITKEKLKFFDKISLVSSALLRSERDAIIDNITDHTPTSDENAEDDGFDDEITHQSDLMRPGRNFFIVTTAAIPWFTGTAVNPLLRAAYLSRITQKINSEARELNSTLPMITTTNGAQQGDNITTSFHGDDQWVTLVIPWLELEEDRLELYGSKFSFSSPSEQEQYIRRWLQKEAGMSEESDPTRGLKIIFYPARYHSGLKSVFAMGDICSLIPDYGADSVCILEEPEHLNWYRAPGSGWTKKFNFVIGIIHTNYVEYASSHYSGLWTAPAIAVMSSAMVRAYCHVVIKLSDTLQTFAPEKEKTSNVHGVRSEFIHEGIRRADHYYSVLNKTKEHHFSTAAGQRKDENIVPNHGEKSVQNATTVYFIGKILWAKGFDKLLEMESYYKQITGNYFAIDIYGNGPEEKEIQRAFLGRKNHQRFIQNGVNSKPSQNMTASAARPETRQDASLGSDSTSSNFDEYLSTQKEDFSMITQSHDIFSNRVQSQTKNSLAAHVTKISNSIKTTTDQIKFSTESLDFDLPKSRYEWRRQPIPAQFPGRIDHAELKEQYKVFINPSLSEVLCTTTAEALAMGKFVIIPVHPSNYFFLQFPNCLGYQNKMEFAANLHWSLSHEPEPLTLEQQNMFSWEAATERLIKVVSITRREARERRRLGTAKLDERIAWFHNELGKGSMGDALRKVLGGGPIAEQVKYEISKRQVDDSIASYATRSDTEDENDDEGLSFKFMGSSLAKAIRTTFASDTSSLNVITPAAVAIGSNTTYSRVLRSTVN